MSFRSAAEESAVSLPLQVSAVILSEVEGPAVVLAFAVAFAIVLAVVRSLPLKPKTVISTEAAHSLIVSSAAEKSAVAFAVAVVVVCSLPQTPSFRPKAAHFAAAVEEIRCCLCRCICRCLFSLPNAVISTEGGALCRRSGEICCFICRCMFLQFTSPRNLERYLCSSTHTHPISPPKARSIPAQGNGL